MLSIELRHYRNPDFFQYDTHRCTCSAPINSAFLKLWQASTVFLFSILGKPGGSVWGLLDRFKAARKKSTRRNAGLLLNAFSTWAASDDPLSNAAWADSNASSQSEYGTTGRPRTSENAEITEDQGVGLGWTICRTSLSTSSASTIAPPASYAVTQVTD